MFRKIDGSISGSQIDDTSTTNAWSGKKIQETIDSALSGGGSGGGVQSGSQAELVALTGLSKGDQFYMIGDSEQKNKLWTFSGRTWQVPGETVELKAGINCVEGNTVEISGSGSTDDFEFKLTTSAEDVHVIGVVALQSVEIGEWASIACNGIWPVACDSQNGQYDRANYLVCHSTDGLASESNSVSAQPFAKILENKIVSTDGELLWAFLHTTEIY